MPCRRYDCSEYGVTCRQEGARGQVRIPENQQGAVAAAAAVAAGHSHHRTGHCWVEWMRQGGNTCPAKLKAPWIETEAGRVLVDKVYTHLLHYSASGICIRIGLLLRLLLAGVAGRLRWRRVVAPAVAMLP